MHFFSLLTLPCAIFLSNVHLSTQKQLITSGYGKQKYPFVDYISINPDNVIFYLYPAPSRWPGVSEFDILTHGKVKSVKESRYNPELPIVLLIHGFTQNLLEGMPQDIVQAYVKSGCASKAANIVAVDWGQLSGPRVDYTSNPDYKFVIDRSIPIVSKRISEFLQFLINNELLSGPDNIHIIGQSLGAHVAGSAGTLFKEATGNMIRRITGTDPAGPLFQGELPEKRLDPSDAHFVDVIHTDAGGYGYNGSIGHVDFFVNGGTRVQPGCEDQGSFCSHNKAPKYYAMSIFSPDLTACGDENLTLDCPEELQIPFGGSCPETARGDYYLTLL